MTLRNYILRSTWIGTAAFLASTALAQPPKPSADAWERFTGDWQIADGGDQSVADAIETATEPMNWIARPIARDQLRKRFTAAALLRLARQGSNFVIAPAGTDPLALPLNGTAVRLGERTVAVHLVDGHLEQIGTTAEGRRIALYRVSADANSMVLEVTATSTRLPRPVHYTIRYHRAGQTPPSDPR